MTTVKKNIFLRCLTLKKSSFYGVSSLSIFLTALLIVSCNAQENPHGGTTLTPSIDVTLTPSGEYSRNTVGSIADWQHILNGCGFGPLKINGRINDPKTLSETKRFQEDVGLPVTGKVDSKTWQAGLAHKKLPNWIGVTPSLSRKSSGYSRDQVGSIADWQHILNGCGFGPLKINGRINDPKTLSETKRFQEDLGLPVTGKVDLKTWQAGLAHKKLPKWIEATPDYSTK